MRRYEIGRKNGGNKRYDVVKRNLRNNTANNMKKNEETEGTKR